MKHSYFYFSLCALAVTAIFSTNASGNEMLPAPSNLNATAAFASEVYLSWNNNSKEAKSITVKRSTDNIHFSTLASLAATSTAYIDSHVKAATTYYYRISASDTSGKSADSNTASAQTTITTVTDPNAVFSEPDISKQPYLSAWKDPVFGTKIMRISNDPGMHFTTQNNGDGVWGKDARHNYQIFQPWSMDGSLYIIENKADDGGKNGGKGSWLNLDAKTYQPKLGPSDKYPGGSADERWNPNPKYATQIIVAGNAQPELFWFDLVSNTITRNWHLPFTPRWLGGGKAHISQDGRFVLLIDKNQEKMVVVDMDPQPPYAPYPNRRVGPVYDIEKIISSASYGGANGGIDPSGKYVVLHYNAKDGNSGNYMRVYDIDPGTLALSIHPMPSNVVQCTGNPSDNWIYSLGHHDLALNAFDNNEPVAVGQEECHNIHKNVPGVKTVNENGIGHVIMVRLRDGAVTALTDPGNRTTIPFEAYAHHVSGQNLKLPGWVFVSYGAWEKEKNYRYYDELIAVSMDGKQRVQRLAHLHSDFHNFMNNNCLKDDKDFNYRSESHGVPSPDGKQIAFASNWLMNGKGTGNCSIQDYIIDLRP